MTPEETVKLKRTRKPKEEVKHLCHVHDKCGDRQSIHKSVCRELKTTEHTDGKHYCLLHLPTKDKDANKVQLIIDERFDEVAERIKKIEAELPEDDWEEAKAKLDYDFRYVWFPEDISFHDKTFSGSADFSSAIFSGYAYFSLATFSGSANFNSATFKNEVSFTSAVFSGSAYFNKTEFNGNVFFSGVKFLDTNFSSAIFHANANFSGKTTFTNSADFSSATFLGSADFSSATFSGYSYFFSATFSGSANLSSATFSDFANFSSATFSGSANFSSATFAEKSQTYFIETRFCSVVRFSKAVIEGYVEFEGNIFLEADKVQDVKKQLETKFAELQTELAKREIKFNFPVHFIKNGQESVFEFRDVRLRNPERVSFNSMRLRPSWFVNVDEARKVAFNDVEWLNTEIDTDRHGLIKERLSLRKRKIRRAKHSLIRAFNQLADNAEANRRFEEAKQFRRNSAAIQFQNKCYISDAIQPDKKDDIRKKVCGDFPVVNEDGGQYYCLWHNPDKNKAEVFLKQFRERQDNGHTDFRAVVFPITLEYQDKIPNNLDFSGATFQRAFVFNNAKLHNLNLSDSYFEEDAKLEFKESTCDGEIKLDKAVFDGKLFFYGGNWDFFAETVVKETRIQASIEKVRFVCGAIWNCFKKKEKISNDTTHDYKKDKDAILMDRALSLKDARFENPQNANFRNIRLRPHYFIEVDVSKFTFHNCGWVRKGGKKLKLKDEIELATETLISQTYNQLAINHEETRNYQESSSFRYNAMEAKRLSNKGFRRITRIFSLFWLYKLVSGYGEKWHWALGVLLAFLIGFGYLYASPFSAFDYGKDGKPPSADTVAQNLCDKVRIIGDPQMNVCEGILHSLSVATFQRPEPKANDVLTKLFIVLEVIFAPLQAALLALAIRRKFMR